MERKQRTYSLTWTLRLLMVEVSSDQEHADHELEVPTEQYRERQQGGQSGDYSLWEVSQHPGHTVFSKRWKTELKSKIECLSPETNPGSWFDRRVRIVLLETRRALRVCTLRERCYIWIIQYYKTVWSFCKWGEWFKIQSQGKKASIAEQINEFNPANKTVSQV